jgi:hypothetical protein
VGTVLVRVVSDVGGLSLPLFGSGPAVALTLGDLSPMLAGPSLALLPTAETKTPPVLLGLGEPGREDESVLCDKFI